MAAATLRVNRAFGLRSALWLTVVALALHVYERNRTCSQSVRTIVMALKGRLGNQLFQVAAGEYYRRVVGGDVSVVYRRNNYSAETDLSGGLFRTLKHFDSMEAACPSVRKRNREYVVEERYSCAPIRKERLTGSCTELEGFWQCPVYAAAGRELVRGLLEGAPEYAVARRKIGELREKAGGKVVVAVHVRRGDYTKRFNRRLLEPVGLAYYERARAEMAGDVTFAVFSDDVEWCRREMKRVLGEGMMVVEEKDATLTLMMMMLADHFLIANSTFSWWAAFLSRSKGKTVVAPRQWFGERVGREVGICPDGWIRV